MTSELVCPFCGEEIKIAGERTTIMSCFNGECCGSGLYGEEAMWQALIQAKQDLGIAMSYVKGISEMVINSGDNIYTVIGHFKKLAEQTLEQIEHKEQIC